MANVTGMRLVQNSDGSYELVAKRAADTVVISPVGSPMRQVYKRTYNERHSAVYTPTKAVNMYERVKSFAKQCDKVTLMAKAKTDPSVLQQRQGFYDDVSTLGDMRDMHRAYTILKGEFEQLGEETQNKLGGSFENFLSNITSGSSAPSIPTEGVEEDKTEEVDFNEQK